MCRAAWQGKQARQGKGVEEREVLASMLGVTHALWGETCTLHVKGKDNIHKNRITFHGEGNCMIIVLLLHWRSEARLSKYGGTPHTSRKHTDTCLLHLSIPSSQRTVLLLFLPSFLPSSLPSFLPSFLLSFTSSFLLSILPHPFFNTTCSSFCLFFGLSPSSSSPSSSSSSFYVSLRSTKILKFTSVSSPRR